MMMTIIIIIIITITVEKINYIKFEQENNIRHTDINKI